MYLFRLTPPFYTSPLPTLPLSLFHSKHLYQNAFSRVMKPCAYLQKALLRNSPTKFNLSIYSCSYCIDYFLLMAVAERQATTSDKTPLQQHLCQHKGLQQTPPASPLSSNLISLSILTHSRLSSKRWRLRDVNPGFLPYSGMFSLPSPCWLFRKHLFMSIMIEETA